MSDVGDFVSRIASSWNHCLLKDYKYLILINLLCMVLLYVSYVKLEGAPLPRGQFSDWILLKKFLMQLSAWSKTTTQFDKCIYSCKEFLCVVSEVIIPFLILTSFSVFISSNFLLVCGLIYLFVPQEEKNLDDTTLSFITPEATQKTNCGFEVLKIADYNTLQMKLIQTK